MRSRSIFAIAFFFIILLGMQHVVYADNSYNNLIADFINRVIIADESDNTQDAELRDTNTPELSADNGYQSEEDSDELFEEAEDMAQFLSVATLGEGERMSLLSNYRTTTNAYTYIVNASSNSFESASGRRNLFKLFLNANTPSPGTLTLTTLGAGNVREINYGHNLVTVPYARQVYYRFQVRDNGGWFASTDTAASLKILSTNSSATTVANLVNISLGPNRTTQSYFTLPANRGMSIEMNTGQYRHGIWPFRVNKGFKPLYEIVYVLDEAAPSIPSQVSLQATGNTVGGILYTNSNSVRVRWNSSSDYGSVYSANSGVRAEASGVKEYSLHINGNSVNGRTPGTTYDFSSLSEGQYNIRVRAIDNAGNISGFSNTVSLVVDRTPPPPPGNPRVPNDNGFTNEHELNWVWDHSVDAHSGRRHYQVYIYEVDSNNDIVNTIVNNRIQTSNSYRHAVEDGKRYRAKVIAVDNAGNASEAFSIPITVAQTATTPNTVDFPFQLNGNKLTYRWGDIGDSGVAIDRYEIALTTSTSTPNANAIIRKESGETKHEFDININSTYYGWIRTVDELGNVSDWQRTSAYPWFSYMGPEESEIYSDLLHPFSVQQKHPIIGDEIRMNVVYSLVGSSDRNYSDIGKTANVQFPADGLWEWYLEIWQYKNGVRLNESLQTTESHRFEILSLPVSGSFQISGLNSNAPIEYTNVREIAANNIAFDSDGQNRVVGVYLASQLGSDGYQSPPSDAVYYELSSIQNNKIPWTLAEMSGTHTLTMWVKDRAGNLSDRIDQSVLLDMIPPSAPMNFSHSPREFTDEETQNTIHFTWRTLSPNDLVNSVDHFIVTADIAGTVITVPQNEVISNIVTENDQRYLETSAAINVSDVGANRPVNLTVIAKDRVGNESIAQMYTAFTKATLGQIVEESGGYSYESESHYLSWQLGGMGVASKHVLENLVVQGNDLISGSSIAANASGMFVHESLNSRGNHEGQYFYRLIALNESGDKTYGEIFTRTVPNTPPSIPVAVSPQNFVNDTIEFSYSQSIDVDGDQITYTVFIGEGLNPSKFVSFYDEYPLEHGKNYTWYVVAEDEYGGISDSDRVTFTVDTELPTLQLLSEVSRPFSNQHGLFVAVKDELSGLDKLRYTYIDNTSNEVLLQNDILLTGLTQSQVEVEIPLIEGSYHIYLTVYDLAGNEYAYPINNVFVDRTTPVLTTIDIENMTNNIIYIFDGRIPVYMEFEKDFSGVSSLEYYLVQGNDRYNASISLSPTLEAFSTSLILNIPSGDYTLAVALIDRAGNRSPVYNLGRVIYDNSPPLLEIDVNGTFTYGSKQYVNSFENLTVEVEYSDAESGVSDVLFAIKKNGELSSWMTWDRVLQQHGLGAGNLFKIAVKAINGVNNSTILYTEELVYDNTPPLIHHIDGISGKSLISGETVSLKVKAIDSESPIIEYALAIGTRDNQTSVSTLLRDADENGWLLMEANERTEFRFQLPGISDGEYNVTLQATNAARLNVVDTSVTLAINNTQERVIVNDQGPYSMFVDQLYGSWQYSGPHQVANYRYRIIDSDDNVLLSWITTADAEAIVEDLQLEVGGIYIFEVQAHYASGGYSLSGFSPGVLIDNTPPELDAIHVPEYAANNGINFQWDGFDLESGITKVEVALGSDFFRTDITGGWVSVHGSDVLLSRNVAGEDLLLINGERYYLTIRLYNGAQLVTERAAAPIIVDNTPPPVPKVVDQGAYINNRQPLAAQWVFSDVDPESGIASYEWALLTSRQPISEAVWQVAPDSRRIILDELVQEHGETYYFAVRATNGAGLTSIGISDGIIVDATAPFIPDVMLLNAINLGDPSAELEVNYITTSEGLALWIDSIDPDTDVVEYFFAWNEREYLDEEDRVSSEHGSILLGNLVINENGEIIVFLGESMNEVGLISPPGYSTGVILDTGAPRVKNVRGNISGDVFLFDWEGEPSLSPIAKYQGALVSEDSMNGFPTAWLDMDLSRRAIIPIDEHADGYYRFLVRAMSEAGTYSRRTGEFDEWGVSPRVILDTTPPEVTRLTVESSFVSEAVRFRIEGEDNLSGIAGYQYAIGTRLDTSFYSKDWINIDSENGWVDMVHPTIEIPHGSEIYVYVRVKDKGGLWSTVKSSDSVLVDHTAPTIPVVSVDQYTTSLNRISEIKFLSDDQESGLSHYMAGVVGEIGGEWLFSSESQAILSSQIELTDLELIEAEDYFVVVRTRNNAGKWSEVGYSEVLTVDTLPPQLDFSAEHEIVINTPELPYEINYELNEEAQVQFTLYHPNGTIENTEVTAQPLRNQFLFTATNYGVYQLETVVTDLAGNIADVILLEIRVNTPPIIKDIPDIIRITPGRLLSIIVGFSEDGTIVDNSSETELQIIGSVEDPDGEPISVSWVQDSLSQGGKIFQNTYSQSADNTAYPVQITVVDNDGGVTTKEILVQVDPTTRGRLLADEVWSGTHRVYDSIIVPAGISLTILPGTEVIFSRTVDTNYTLQIHGSLLAGAVNADPVRFSHTNDIIGGWGGIIAAGNVDLNNIVIQHGVRGLTVLAQSLTTIDNSRFVENMTGIHAYGGNPVIRNTVLFSNVIYGLKEDAGADPVLQDSIFSNNGYDYYDEELAVISVDQLNDLGSNKGNISQ